MGVRVAALLWGLAEATLFFIVPDVLLSFIALRDRPLALRCCLYALAGALAGGLVMYGCGQLQPAASLRLLDAVPAIDEAMLQRVEGELHERGAAALLLGPLRGTPYKVYAVQAGRAGLPLAAFLLVSVPARLGRFLLVTLLAATVGGTLGRTLDLPRRRALLAAVWCLFYVIYFQRMGL